MSRYALRYVDSARGDNHETHRREWILFRRIWDSTDHGEQMGWDPIHTSHGTFVRIFIDVTLKDASKFQILNDYGVVDTYVIPIEASTVG